MSKTSMDYLDGEVKTGMDLLDENRGAVLTVDEAHGVIGKDKISRASLYNAIGRNELPHIRLGRRILIPRHALSRYLEGTATA